MSYHNGYHQWDNNDHGRLWDDPQDAARELASLQYFWGSVGLGLFGLWKMFEWLCRPPAEITAAPYAVRPAAPTAAPRTAKTKPATKFDWVKDFDADLFMPQGGS